MKHFLFKLGLFFVLLSSLAWIINVYQGKTAVTSDYVAAIVDKHRRVHGISTPKIVFAGGSHLAFGLDSEMMQQQFRVPVVNLGINSGLGLDFMLEEVKHVLGEGDVVVLSFAYLQTRDGILKLQSLASDAYSPAAGFYHPGIYERLEWFLIKTRQNFLDLVKDTGRSIRLQVTGREHRDASVYARKSFNKYGDVVAHLDRKPKKKLLDGEIFRYEFWEGIEPINEFNDYAKAKNARVYFLYGNQTEPEYRKNRAVVHRLAADIERHMEVEQLNGPADFVFDEKLFFDSVYHLHTKGRSMQTKMIIERLYGNAGFRQHLESVRSRYYPICCEQY